MHYKSRVLFLVFFSINGTFRLCGSFTRILVLSEIVMSSSVIFIIACSHYSSDTDREINIFWFVAGCRSGGATEPGECKAELSED